jgi:hypothetical protein
MTVPIRAEIIDSDRCEAEGHTVRAAAPVLAMCRKLVDAGYDQGRPLHAYRGDMLSLKVRSIGEGALLTVEDNRFGTPTLRRWRKRPLGDGAAPPVEERAGPATTVARRAA